jgi:NAD(P)-dependent dehydrogenase (short-subunit alcohol dehydrogenase family)
LAGLLEGKIALVTGIAGGQWRAAALAFTAEGATVVGCDVSSEGHAETVRLVEQRSGKIVGSAPIDLTDPEQVRGWINEGAKRCGGIDILYNNDGDARFAPIADMALEDWWHTLKSEVDTVFFATKYAWPHRVRRGGGSTAGMIGSLIAPMGAHSAGKAAVIGLTRQTAVEGAPHGIRAVSINPGPITTPASAAHMAAMPQLSELVASRTLLHRWGNPEEVVSLAIFLASDKASFITGANYPVDGGVTAV